MNPVLRFLADESCDFAVVRALRADGYDVVAVSEVTRCSTDHEVIAKAYKEKRILITEDKDFGWLVFASLADDAGVILIRFPGNLRKTLVQVIRRLVQEQGENLHNAFVIVQPGHIRIRRLPRISGE